MEFGGCCQEEDEKHLTQQSQQEEGCSATGSRCTDAVIDVKGVLTNSIDWKRITCDCGLWTGQLSKYCIFN